MNGKKNVSFSYALARFLINGYTVNTVKDNKNRGNLPVPLYKHFFNFLKKQKQTFCIQYRTGMILYTMFTVTPLVQY